METADTTERIKELLDMTSKEPKLSKSLLGGYNRKEVEQYIKCLRTGMEELQKAFGERTDDYSRECEQIRRERDDLLQKQQELEAELSAQLAKEREKAQRMEALELENDRLNELVQSLRMERENIRKSMDIQTVDALTKQNEALVQENGRLQGENEEHRKCIAEMNDAVASIKTDLAKKEETLEELNISRRSFAMETNMKLYHYRLNLDSNVKHAKQSIEDLLEMMDLLKCEADAMYERTRVLPE